MAIKIATRLTPFSHAPGASCIVPGTLWEIEAYPTLLRVGRVDMRLYIHGPVEGFTLELDLERHCVRIFGTAKEGFFSLRFQGEEGGFALFVERAPKEGLNTSHRLLERKERLFFPASIEWRSSAPMERLSLGSHKSQEWSGIAKRGDLKELLPLFFALSQKLPQLPPEPLKGTGALLELPSQREKVGETLRSFLKAAFTNMMIPRLFDDDYQGLAPDEPIDGNRFFLVQKLGEVIRSLFVEQDEKQLSLLPLLPPEFHAGRMTGVVAPSIGTLDFEWSKGQLRRLHLTASKSRSLQLLLPKTTSSYRLKRSAKEKGVRQKVGERFEIEDGNKYLFDNFS